MSTVTNAVVHVQACRPFARGNAHPGWCPDTGAKREGPSAALVVSASPPYGRDGTETVIAAFDPERDARYAEFDFEGGGSDPRVGSWGPTYHLWTTSNRLAAAVAAYGAEG